MSVWDYQYQLENYDICVALIYLSSVQIDQWGVTTDLTYTQTVTVSHIPSLHHHHHLHHLHPTIHYCILAEILTRLYIMSQLKY